MNKIAAENVAEIEKRYRLTAIIVLTQILTTIVLIVVGWFYAASSENAASPDSLLALWIAVIFIAVGTFFLRRMLNRWERLKNIALTKGISGVLAALQTNSLIIGALAEVIAVIGFLIAVLGGVKFDVFRAGAVALLVFLINFPRKTVWKKIVINLENVQEVFNEK
ncbi:hypothetical protein BH20ACI1_BH20ACI1_23420 [soil metagenome]